MLVTNMRRCIHRIIQFPAALYHDGVTKEDVNAIAKSRLTPVTNI